MDWLKSILGMLPLDKISDILGEIIIWWSQLVKGVPPADLPMYAYTGGAIIVLILWLLVARMLPKPLGGMSWMLLFAVLLAPGTALSDPGTIAPATISVIYALMMKDTTAAISNAIPILVVLVAGLFIGFVWPLIRGAFESSLDKARIRTTDDVHANMQLATGNYLAASTLKEDKVAIPVAISKSNDAKTAAPKTTVAPKTTAKEKVVAKINTPKTATTEIDSTLKKDSELTVERKPIEGFYNKKSVKETSVIEPVATSKTIKEPVLKVDGTNVNNINVNDTNNDK